MNLVEYARLSPEKKQQVLLDEALFIENYMDDDATVNVYVLNDFFIEATFRNGVMIDTIPYQRGYKVHPSKMSWLEKRPSLLPAA